MASKLQLQTLADLKKEAERRGIKKKGVGWPTCCPPNGNRADVIQALLRLDQEQQQQQQQQQQPRHSSSSRKAATAAATTQSKPNQRNKITRQGAELEPEPEPDSKGGWMKKDDFK